MTRRFVGPMLGVMALTALLGVPSTAASDGLPLPSSITPSNGVPGADETRYVTGHADGSTVVRELGNGGRLQAAKIQGQWWIPAVTAKGSPGGLSADGSTLVLVKSGSRIAHGPTRLLLLDARNLEVAQRLTLHGAFSFDAISPDASKLYFIQYLSGRNPTRHALRGPGVRPNSRSNAARPHRGSERARG